MYHENHNVSWKSSCIMKIIQTIVIIIMMALQTTHHLLYLPSYLAAGVLLFEVENKVIRISRSSIITCSTFSPGSAAKRLAASSCSEPRHILARVLAGSGSWSPLWWYYIIYIDDEENICSFLECVHTLPGKTWSWSLAARLHNDASANACEDHY